jgi:hypothetical protein
VIPALQLDFVAVTETDGVLIVGFADDPVETIAYFVIQRAKPPTDDEVYVERDGQEYSGYGRVRRWTLTRCCGFRKVWLGAFRKVWRVAQGSEVIQQVEPGEDLLARGARMPTRVIGPGGG